MSERGSIIVSRLGPLPKQCTASTFPLALTIVSIAAISLSEIALRLSSAVLCGVALGLNREVHRKQAGVRTQTLVSLGAAVATVTAALVAGPTDGASVTRVIQGIVAGVGFLGAGVILKEQSTQIVHGLTTAAVTWFSACMGIACGAGLWATAAVALGLSLFVLTVGGPFERWIHLHFFGEQSPPPPP